MKGEHGAMDNTVKGVEIDPVRKKLTKLLGEAHSKSAEAACFEDATYAKQLRMEADHLIANGVTVQKWIPVTERLPEGEKLVMIHCKNGAMFVGYCGKQYCDYERRWRIKTALNSTKLLNVGRVTHWAELPEPPKGE